MSSVRAQAVAAVPDEADDSDQPESEFGQGDEDWAIVSVRLTHAERLALRRAGVELGRSTSAQARRFLIEGLEAEGFLAPGGRAPPAARVRAPNEPSPAEISEKWCEDARRVDLLQVAAELGIDRTRDGRLTPCPACRERTRSRTDPREGPVYVIHRGTRWKCGRCSARGDALDLVARVLRGTDCDLEAAPAVRAWFAARGWCEAEPAPELEELPPEPGEPERGDATPRQAQKDAPSPRKPSPQIDYGKHAAEALQCAVDSGNFDAIYNDPDALRGIARPGEHAGDVERLLTQLPHLHRTAMRRAGRAIVTDTNAGSARERPALEK